MTLVEVISPGALTTLQDLGRPGFAHIGVPRSGAADRPALVLANRLVGNEDGAVALETTLRGPRLRFHGPAVVALTGAPVGALAMNEPIALATGAELRVGTASRGLRTYVAFAGGIQAPLTLGSAATDTLTGIGPAPLRAGDVLELASPQAEDLLELATPPTGDVPELARGRGRCTPRATAGTPGPQAVLRVVLGPRADWFSALALARLTSAEFTVSHQANRVGLRLDGPLLERARDGELRSEGLVPGAIQVPGDGRPILLLADHPTTGGYPVIAVVHSQDIALAAQLRPGDRLALREARPCP